MKVIKRTESNKIATVFIAENEQGKLVEFVESTQPPLSAKDKWVVIISTLFGCPVDCQFCDAGGNYRGRLTAEELLFQIDYLVSSKFKGDGIDSRKFKIQFSRMGEPSFNPAVLDVLPMLKERYPVTELIPSLSTIGPKGTDNFFDRLLKIKKEYFPGTFQLQFSLHSTDPVQRDMLIPVKKRDFNWLGEYGSRFYDAGGKKVTLNFALTSGTIIDPARLSSFFDPSIFLVKITPMNPTYKASKNNLNSFITSERESHPVVDELRNAGYEVIVSIGEWEENEIGSNCGQYIETFLKECDLLENGYSSILENI
jgi:23S rRNA (adenine2503-C2)-methyltransferase